MDSRRRQVFKKSKKVVPRTEKEQLNIRKNHTGFPIGDWVKLVTFLEEEVKRSAGRSKV